MFSVLAVTIIVNMIICYHLIIGGMSISKCILESSFSCGNGGLVTVINIWMWQVFCLHVNTDLLQHFLLASIYNLYICSMQLKLCLISCYIQSQSAYYFSKNFCGEFLLSS